MLVGKAAAQLFHASDVLATAAYAAVQHDSQQGPVCHTMVLCLSFNNHTAAAITSCDICNVCRPLWVTTPAAMQ